MYTFCLAVCTVSLMAGSEGFPVILILVVQVWGRDKAAVLFALLIVAWSGVKSCWHHLRPCVNDSRRTILISYSSSESVLLFKRLRPVNVRFLTVRQDGALLWQAGDFFALV